MPELKSKHLSTEVERNYSREKIKKEEIMIKTNGSLKTFTEEGMLSIHFVWIFLK